jgi:hypothetical protein
MSQVNPQKNGFCFLFTHAGELVRSLRCGGREADRSPDQNVCSRWGGWRRPAHSGRWVGAPVAS